MKRVLSLAAILLVIAAIIGCEKPEPQAPTLISPEDGTVFETEPPTFIWSWEEFTDNYVIRIYMGSSTDIQDTLSDTTYAMSKTLFETLLNGTYNWLAAAMSEDGELFWSESWSFVIEKPEEPQGLDLDTTYFPFGMDYEWEYQQHRWEYGDYEPWDEYDTVTNTVTDSFWLEDTLVFEINSAEYVKIWDNQITVLGEKVNLVPEPETRSDSLWMEFIISYRGDTLRISGCIEAPEGWPPSIYDEYTVRLRGIGSKGHASSWTNYYSEYSSGTSYRLLYFYNGQDTVYKAE